MRSCAPASSTTWFELMRATFLGGDNGQRDFMSLLLVTPIVLAVTLCRSPSRRFRPGGESSTLAPKRGESIGIVEGIVAEESKEPKKQRKLEISGIIALLAFSMSAVSFYRSYFYKFEQLVVTVTDVSYVTNEGGLYITVAFTNGGNRDAALLRVEPLLWSRQRGKADPAWVSIAGKVDPDIPVTDPKTPTVVRAGGVELVRLSAKLDPTDAEQALVAAEGAAFLGIRVATMKSDGNLYQLQRAVAKLVIDKRGRISSAQPAIHRSLSGFVNVDGPPPGDTEQENEKTPFVWADEHGS